MPTLDDYIRERLSKDALEYHQKADSAKRSGRALDYRVNTEMAMYCAGLLKWYMDRYYERTK